MLQDGWPEPQRWKELVSHLDHIEDVKLEDPTRCEQILIDVARRNPKPGAFLSSLAMVVDMFRQHSVAEPLLKQAVLLMPQLSLPKNALGQLYMQTGQIEDAKKTLDEAFKADPYHVRVSNMRKVIKVLEDYESITTDHFVVRADGKLDKLLARYMAEYLEEVYPELTTLFGFEPAARTQIEIYNTAKGLSGHQWFSARMVGLPWVQTIGASTGVIIAMQSPGSMEHPLNWARVLKHEFVHILTLQQTNFNIPHWYTGLRQSDQKVIPRPVEWNSLLLNRVPKGKLKNLDNLSMGFIRAGNQENWNFAYCQSVLCTKVHGRERFGEENTAAKIAGRLPSQSHDRPGGSGSVWRRQSRLRKRLSRIPRQAGRRSAKDRGRNRATGIANRESLRKKQERSQGCRQLRQADVDHQETRRSEKDRRGSAEAGTDTAGRRNGSGACCRSVKRNTARSREDPWEPALNQEHPNKNVLELLMKVRLKQKRAGDAIVLLPTWAKATLSATSANGGRGPPPRQSITGAESTEKRREALQTLVQIEADDPAPERHSPNWH